MSARCLSCKTELKIERTRMSLCAGQYEHEYKCPKCGLIWSLDNPYLYLKDNETIMKVY
jgi:hypothetical protein